MPGTTAFPTALDTGTFPDIDGAADDMDSPPHDEQHNNAAAAILAIEEKLGIDDSTDETSIDYRVQRLEGIVGAIITQLGPDPVVVTGAFDDPIEDGDPITGTLTIADGWAPHTVRVQSGTAPPGVSFGVSSLTVVSTGNTTTTGAYSWTLRVFGADGSYDDVACSIDVISPGWTAWNPADKSAYIVLSETDRLATSDTGNPGWAVVRAEIDESAATADHYFEVEVAVLGSGWMVGVGKAGVGFTSADFYAIAGTGVKWNSGSGTAYGSAPTTSDVIGVLLKNGKIYFAINNTWQGGGDPVAETGAAFTGLTGDFFPMAVMDPVGMALRLCVTGWQLNYTPPTGSAPWDPTP